MLRRWLRNRYFTQLNKDIDLTQHSSWQRVSAGFAYCDERFGPAWVRAIDLDRLDIVDGQHCILGQLTGNTRGWYTEAIEAVGSSDEDILAWAHDHGFVSGVDIVAWQTQIMARLAEWAPPTVRSRARKLVFPVRNDLNAATIPEVMDIVTDSDRELIRA